MHPDIHALSGAYAVDALDDVERDRFEEHLRDCEACREEVAGLQEAAGLLGASAATPPPDRLRDDVLAAISQVRPLPPEVTADAGLDERPASLAGHAARRRRRTWALLAAAAAVVAVLGTGLAGWAPWRDDSSLTDRVLAADDATSQTIVLDGASATLVRSEELARAVLVTEDMPAPPDGKVYEVWLQDDAGGMLPAGLMPIEEDQEFLLDGDASAATGVGITVEPEGGSPEPTTDPIVLFDFGEQT